MSIDVVVTGIGLKSALGRLTPSWEKLLCGQSAIRPYQLFPELAPRPLALIDSSPADLASLTQQIVADALQDARLTVPLPNCGIVLGSSRGYQAKLEQLATTFITHSQPFSPLAQFSNFLPNAAALAAVRLVGATESVLTPAAACSTAIWALAQGFELIQTGQCQRVLAGAVETPITPLTVAGFLQMGALATTGCYPFDHQREGFILGEGGAIFVLESAALAKQRNAKIYGKILGFGLTNDARYATAPEIGGRSSLLAVKQCLERSHLSPHQIDYIHAHGTGTQLNDQHEAVLIQHLFSPSVAVSSTKGATGHTLGASAALGAAFCLMTLNHQKLPPCVGLTTSEFALNFVRNSQSWTVQNVLCFSFGFGGQNAVVALGKYQE